MDSKLSKFKDGLHPTFTEERYMRCDRILAVNLDVCSTYSQLGSQKYHKFLFSILSLCLWGIIGITTIAGFAPTALALDYNKEILIESDFSGRDLRDSSFTQANLRQSNFSNANLQGVSFFSANLESANFQGADLTNATLGSARFIKTNLTNAILEGAFVSNAKFDGAIIDGADFTDVLFRPDVQKKLCKVAKGTNPTTGRDTRETLFCP